MPTLRPLTRCLHRPPISHATSRASVASARSSLPQSPPSRLLSSAHTSEDGHDAHDSKYDPPGGWLFGEKPGEKYEKQGWEGLFIYGYCGSLLVAAILYAYKPDTSIQTWALEEARRRLEKEGVLEDPFPESGEAPRKRRYYEARDN